jgi:putative RecB family exonuclease
VKTELPVLDGCSSDPIHLDHLSYSAIHSFQTCPRQFMFRYVVRLPDEKTFSSLVFGTALHAAVERHFVSILEGEAPPDLDTLLSTFWYTWQEEEKPIHFNKKEDLDTIGHLADRMLRAFQASSFARPEGRIIGIEEELRGLVAENSPEFEARVDLIIQTNEALVITDFKTALSRWNPAKVEAASPQLLIYHKLTEDMSDGRPLRLNFAVLTKRKKPILTLHPVASDAERMEQTIQTIDDTWAAIQQGDFFPNPSPARCPRCPFQETCRTW